MRSTSHLIQIGFLSFVFLSSGCSRSEPRPVPVSEIDPALMKIIKQGEHPYPPAVLHAPHPPPPEANFKTQ